MCPVRQLTLVFVYGTLKKGEPNHFWLTNKDNGFAEFVGNASTDTKFPLIIGTKFNIPFLLNVPGTGTNIKGEIYSIDDTMLKNLDELEDYPSLYDRNIFEVNGANGTSYSCWIYMLKQFPDAFLQKYTFVDEYKNSVEQPYSESYLEFCTPEDLYNS